MSGAGETLGRIIHETDDGLLYVDTGFGSQMKIIRSDSPLLEKLKRLGRAGDDLLGVIYSYLYLVEECDPSIPGCDPDEDARRLKALRKALATPTPSTNSNG